jgi:quercetin dioxygenase-like cupin family protein
MPHSPPIRGYITHHNQDPVMADSQTQPLVGQVLDPPGLVAYQEGAVVSRTIVVRKSGTVTLFAFDKDEGLSEHTAPFDAMVQVLEGDVMITISGTPFTLKKGDMIIMPANKPHALKAITRFKMMLTMIHE